MSELAEFLQSRAARLGLKIAGVVVALGLVGTAGWLWLRAEEARGQAALAGAAEAVQQGEGPWPPRRDARRPSACSRPS